VETQAIIEEHLPGLDDRLRSTAARLIEVILAELPHAEYERRWGRLTFTLNRHWHHWICAVSPARSALKLVIHKGSMLADPHRAMEGEGRYIRAIHFRAPDEVDAAVVAPILQEAAARQTEMLPGGSS
jgi:hypothetical protein